MTGKTKRNIWVIAIILVVLVVCGVILGCYFKQFDGGWSLNQEDWGNFGAYVGGILGAIFGGVSVIFVYLTYNNQRETSLRAEFENHLFKMLDTQRDIMKACQGVDGSKGSIYFARVADKLYTNLFQKLEFDKKRFSIKEDCYLEEIKKSYNELLLNGNAQLNHYFRHLYHILKYIDTSCNIDDKRQYIDLVQSQLSNDELYLCVYNGLVEQGKKLGKLMDKYSFLENVIFEYMDPLRIFCQNKFFYRGTDFKDYVKYSQYKWLINKVLNNIKDIEIEKRTNTNCFVTSNGDILFINTLDLKEFRDDIYNNLFSYNQIDKERKAFLDKYTDKLFYADISKNESISQSNHLDCCAKKFEQCYNRAIEIIDTNKNLNK